MSLRLPTIKVMSLFAIMFIVFSGCGDDSSSQSDPSDLFGTWIETSVTVNDDQANLSDVLEWETGTVEGSIAFYSDGTYEAIELDSSDSVLYMETGTYYTDDNWLIMTTSVVNDLDVTPEQSFNGTWSISGSTLTVAQTIGSDTMVLTLSRPE